VVAANVVVAVVMAKVEVVLDVLGCSPQNWHLNFFSTATKSWKFSGTLQASLASDRNQLRKRESHFTDFQSFDGLEKTQFSIGTLK